MLVSMPQTDLSRMQVFQASMKHTEISLASCKWQDMRYWIVILDEWKSALSATEWHWSSLCEIYVAFFRLSTASAQAWIRRHSWVHVSTELLLFSSSEAQLNLSKTESSDCPTMLLTRVVLPEMGPGGCDCAVAVAGACCCCCCCCECNGFATGPAACGSTVAWGLWSGCIIPWCWGLTTSATEHTLVMVRGGVEASPPEFCKGGRSVWLAGEDELRTSSCSLTCDLAASALNAVMRQTKTNYNF